LEAKFFRLFCIEAKHQNSESYWSAVKEGWYQSAGYMYMFLFHSVEFSHFFKASQPFQLQKTNFNDLKAQLGQGKNMWLPA
jgi:hypothetical protein